MRWPFVLAGFLFTLLVLAHAPLSPTRERLPCASTDLQPGSFWIYCVLGRNYVREGGVEVLREAQARVETAHGRSPLIWTDASGPWPGTLWPHRSHGSGHQIDVALYYEGHDGRLKRNPTGFAGYFAYEPTGPEEAPACTPGSRPLDFGDPPTDRTWRWDAARNATLVTALLEDARVRRIFLEPHLVERLGLSGHPKIGFAGCRAARHDDHIHIDLH